MMDAVASKTTKTLYANYEEFGANLPSVKTSMVARVVGYYEYMQALAHLEPLVKASTAAELKAMNEVVQARDEFKIFTNLSRRLETAPGPLSEPAGNHEKQRLDWVMGLARIELAALVAGFSDKKRPFELLPPTAFEAEAYSELLVDGLRTHYLALRNDPVVQRYLALRGVALANYPTPAEEREAIAYSRRVAIVNEFLSAVERAGGDRLNPAQRAQLATWKTELRKLQETIMFKILQLDARGQVNTKVDTRVQTLMNKDCYVNSRGSCGAMMRQLHQLEAEGGR